MSKPFQIIVPQKKGEKTYWNKNVGSAFINYDDDGSIKSINIDLAMFPGLDLVAFPPKPKDENSGEE